MKKHLLTLILFVCAFIASVTQVSVAQTDVINIHTSNNVGIGPGSTTPVSYLDVSGSFGQKVTTISANRTLDVTDNTVVCNPSGGSFIVTLPAASGCSGRVYIIKRNATVTANTVTIAGGATIDGAASFVLNSPNQSIEVFSDGTEWKSTVGGLSGLTSLTAGNDIDFGTSSSPNSIDIEPILNSVHTISAPSSNNLNLNAASGFAAVINANNGTTGPTNTFRIGDGVGGSDVFYVQANGNFYAANNGQVVGNLSLTGTTKTLIATGIIGNNTFNPAAPTIANSNIMYADNASGAVYSLRPATVASTLTSNASGQLSWASSTGTGIQGYWNRTGTTLAPTNTNDLVSVPIDRTASFGITGNNASTAPATGDRGGVAGLFSSSGTSANGYLGFNSNTGFPDDDNQTKPATAGVYGIYNGTTANRYAVYGEVENSDATSTTNKIAIYGRSNNSSGNRIGVVGDAMNSGSGNSRAGILGLSGAASVSISTNISGTSAAVMGIAEPGDYSLFGYSPTSTAANPLFAVASNIGGPKTEKFRVNADGQITTSLITAGFVKTTASGVLSSASQVALSSEVTGTLPVANGGTGATTLTGIVLGNGTSALTATTTSGGIAGAISDETGTGSVVFSATPTFTGTPAAPTAALNTNTTQLATTAFVIGQASSTTPNALGTAAVGTGTTFARADHVHPAINLGSGANSTFTGILPVANGGTGSSSQNWVDLTTTQTAAGAKTWSNNATFNGGTTTLGNATSNLLYFNPIGVGAPAFTTRSAGTKIVFYPQVSATDVDYAIGLDGSTLWYSVPGNTSSYFHKFYGGTAELMRIQGDGNVGIGTTRPLAKLQVGADNLTQPGTVGTLTPAVRILGTENNITEASILRLVRPTNNNNLWPSAVDFKMSSYATALGNPYLPKTQLTIGLKASTGAQEDFVDVITLRDNGRVGIGTTAPTLALLDVNQNSGVSPGTAIKFGSRGFLVSPSTILSDNAYYNGTAFVNVANDFSTYLNLAGGAYRFNTSPSGASPVFTERMIIDNIGRVGIGATPGVKLDVQDVAANSFVANFFNLSTNTATANNGIVIRAGNASGSVNSSFYVYLQRGDGNYIGGISQSSAGTVAYNTSSDKRLKENILSSSHGLSDINRLAVKDYNYIGDTTKVTGLIAQEVYNVIPSVVHVGGDDVKTNAWGIDYGKFTPYLIKAVQEQQQMIDMLKQENLNLKSAKADVSDIEKLKTEIQYLKDTLLKAEK